MEPGAQSLDLLGGDAGHGSAENAAIKVMEPAC